MAIKEILLLGNPQLYCPSEPVEQQQLNGMVAIVEDLRHTLHDFRAKYHAGRAIAAPQIGIMKRLIYMETDQSIIFINPTLDRKSEQMIEIWDDCLCFPDLLVKVRRHAQCWITFKDLQWQTHSMLLKNDVAELLQHECDHLDGILATSRAVDEQSFALKSQYSLLSNNRR